MRIAALADVHGNAPALEAVLAEVEREAVDRVVLCGDLAAGPLPGPTLIRVAALGDRAVLVRGNADRGLVAGHDGTGGDRIHPDDRAVGRVLTRAQRDRLDGLPLTVTLDVDGLGPVLFCHGSPRRDDEVLLVDSPPERWRAALAGVTAGVVVLGHTHMPFDRLVDGRRVINPGSVGMPYGHEGAAWALLGPDVVLRRTPYPVEAAVARLLASPWADAGRWVDDHVRRRAGDLEALEAFRGAAGD